MGEFITFKSDRGLNSQTPARLFRDLQGTEMDTADAVRETWRSLGFSLKTRANSEILRRPRKGRVYRIRGKNGNFRRHVASEPGESHANMRGDLRRAIAWNVHGNLDFSFGYGLNNQSSPKYDEFVEFGTRRMAARPSLLLAIEHTQGNTQGHFAREMNRRFGS